jgi:hypothetical protein
VVVLEAESLHVPLGRAALYAALAALAVEILSVVSITQAAGPCCAVAVLD